MSRLALVLFPLLLFALLVHSAPQSTEAPTILLPDGQATPTIQCGANARAVTNYKHLNCYDNCANRNQPRPCPYLLNYGEFCECNEGFIYRIGTSGDCTRPSDC